DRDQQALTLAQARLGSHSARITLVHAIYDEIPLVLHELGVPRVQGVLFDLGVSSLQLDARERGFSYSQDAPLDMRMDPATSKTAAEVLNTYSVAELAHILSRYGEERFSRRIAQSVVRERAKMPFDNSARLVDLIRESIPAPARRTGGNPAKRTFQALRIEVNDELAVLERALPLAVEALAVGGRIVVMSYHSLEDRLVKRALTSRARSTAPVDLPVVPQGHEPELRLVTRGAETASETEVMANPRAASVRLRAAERIRDAA
ncbi:MAG: 16S rRNA (cytosine(1402)-N(4))-methyltransferase RsmH, partial [Nocardioidaceae bacterium]|nr:16S rRNA (cytosine(1402)-N(4))-methyltransferase RsmH [Nocardioidaceae bacterium]